MENENKTLDSFARSIGGSDKDDLTADASLSENLTADASLSENLTADASLSEDLTTAKTSDSPSESLSEATENLTASENTLDAELDKARKNRQVSEDLTAAGPEALTGKNADYVHAVTKQLLLAGKSDEEVKAILADTLPKILEGQKTGLTARAQLGTPTEFAQNYLTTVKEVEKKEYNDKPLLMWFDDALLAFAALSVLNGAMLTFNKNSRGYGLTALIVSALVGGWVLYMMYRFYYKDLKTGERPKFKLRQTALFVLIALVWMGISIAAMILPASINPQLPGVTLVVAGVVIFALRYWLKTVLKIKPSLTPYTAPAVAPKKK